VQNLVEEMLAVLAAAAAAVQNLWEQMLLPGSRLTMHVDVVSNWERAELAWALPPSVAT
jgi:hypothetical protein